MLKQKLTKLQSKMDCIKAKKARKSACKATAAPAQSLSSTNDTNFIIPLSLNRPLHQDNILLDLTMVPRSVSVSKACVYPFNSSRLQRHTLGKMDL